MLVDELKELKEKKRITNQELADKSGVHFRALQRPFKQVDKDFIGRSACYDRRICFFAYMGLMQS